MASPRRFASIVMATALMAGLLASTLAPAAAEEGPTIPTTASGAPATIPGLSAWNGTEGSFRFTADTSVVAPAALAAVAANAASDLGAALGTGVEVHATGAAAGDVVLSLDTERTDLGDEGYEIAVAETIEVTAATETGAFYGATTATQWAVLAGTSQAVPAGVAIDVPEFPIRSVGICACIVNISVEKFEQVIKEMAYYKMNELWIELKVASEAYPEATFWSYYTNEQAAHLAEFAAAHHVRLVSEVNSPGHMGPWLQNLPELQLVNSAGVRQPTQLDISQPEALDVVTTLASEYIEKFSADYYHMGADEYLLGSGSFQNFPQIIAAARAKFGAEATEGDLFVDFINQVNAHVKSEGATLRIWNDGIPRTTNIVELDTDIIVEFWDNAGRSMENTLVAGNDVVNTDNRFYFTRNNNWGTAQARWDEGWTPHRYLGRDVDDSATEGRILGGKMVLWPDNGPGKTENQLFNEIHETLRYLAQASWSTERPTATYPAFRALGDQLGEGPNAVAVDYAPLTPGDYAVGAGDLHLTAGTPVAMSDEEAIWTFTTTADGYYKIAQGAQCLAMAPGDSLNLSSPNTFGQQPILTACTEAGSPGNLQKWWVKRADGGFTLSHAISNMPLVVDGTDIAQQDPNLNEPTLFQFVGDGIATTVRPISGVLAGQTQRVDLTLRNLSTAPVTDVTVTPVLPAGWLVSPATLALDELAGQGEQGVRFHITPNAGPAGHESIGFTTSWTEAGELRERSVSVPLAFSCAASATSPVEVVRVSSEQNDTAERAPAVNTIDGDPNTFWHTQWNGTEPAHPHQLVVGLDDAAELCAVTLTPRQGVSSGAVNGQIKDYELYATTDATVAQDTSGTPAGVPSGWTLVAEGSLPSGQSPQWIPFETPVQAKYVLLVSRSAQNPSHVWTTLGEFSVDVATPDTTDPVVEALADIDVEQGEALVLPVRAADASAVTFTATGLPQGLSIDEATGIIAGTATTAGASEVIVTVTDASGNATTVSFTLTVTESGPTEPTDPDPTEPTDPDPTEPTDPDPTEPTDPEPTQPAPGFTPTAPYTLPGLHVVNGRHWHTTCEPYSQTQRCRTDIWATTIKIVDGKFVRTNGWSFNNLTYLPYLDRAAWAQNPLGHAGEWTAADGRQWRTECDTPRTGRDGCRSYVMATSYSATPRPGGGWTFHQADGWVFNNIVMFGR